MTFEKTKIYPTNQKMKIFAGELLAEVSGRAMTGAAQNRWHDIRIFRTSGGNFVPVVDYFTCWEGWTIRP